MKILLSLFIMNIKFKLSYKVCCLEIWKMQEWSQITSFCLYFLLMKTFRQVISMGRWYHSACTHTLNTFLHDYTCRSGTILTWLLTCCLNLVVVVGMWDKWLWVVLVIKFKNKPLIFCKHKTLKKNKAL